MTSPKRFRQSQLYISAIPPLIIGLTVVAFGTSAPELVVNVIAALEDHTSLAFGNVAGSNLANLGLVLGVAAVIRPVNLEGQLVRRELALLMLVTSMLAVMVLDAALSEGETRISRSDGLILLLMFSTVIYISVGDLFRSSEDPLVLRAKGLEQAMQPTEVTPAGRDWLYIGTGVLGLLVLNTRKLADHFKEEITISVFLKDTANELEIGELQVL